jgi:hypothetical protein
MTVLVRYSPTSLSRDVYDRVNDVLSRQGQEGPPRELELHVLFGEDPNLRVSEVWESEEAWRRFRDVLSHAFDEVGLDMPEPEIVTVHEMWGSALHQPV